MVRILSIDGGGIRGLIPATVLVTFEHLLQKYSGREDARLVDYFDLIAGTSTGGILAAIYLCPSTVHSQMAKFKAEDAVSLYKENGAKIFHKTFVHSLYAVFGLANAKYKTKGFEEVLDTYYRELKLSQLLKPCLIPAYDIEKKRAVFFNQLDPFKEGHEDFFVKDIIRGTTAAPTYFKPASILSSYNGSYSLIDGGVFANNPALCAYTEARKLKPKSQQEDYFILSLGTGSNQRGYPYEQAKNWGGAGWVRPLFSILQGGVAETVDYQLQSMYNAAKKQDHYLRIQIDLTQRGRGITQMDNTYPDNLKLLEEIGHELAEVYYDRLEQFARKIVSMK